MSDKILQELEDLMGDDKQKILTDPSLFPCSVKNDILYYFPNATFSSPEDWPDTEVTQMMSKNMKFNKSDGSLFIITIRGFFSNIKTGICYMRITNTTPIKQDEHFLDPLQT